MAAARIAKSAGVRAILNPAPAVDLRNSDLSAVYALTPNDTEARVCLGLAPDDAVSQQDLAGALLDLGVENVVMTLGARGALWASQQGFCRVPALQVSVVDRSERATPSTPRSQLH